jgi:hypothetical protein
LALASALVLSPVPPALLCTVKESPVAGVPEICTCHPLSRDVAAGRIREAPGAVDRIRGRTRERDGHRIQQIRVGGIE